MAWRVFGAKCNLNVLLPRVTAAAQEQEQSGDLEISLALFEGNLESIRF